MGCIIAIIIVVLIGLFATYPIPALIITVLLIIIGVFVYRSNKEKEEAVKEEQLSKK
jgi:type III secretory pathway component EscV